MLQLHTETRTPYDSLLDYVLQTASRSPELITEEAPLVTADDLAAWAEDEVVIVEDEGQARLCRLLAEALVSMSGDVHKEHDRALDGRLTPATATLYVKAAGSLRKAEKLTGIAKSTLQRAIQEARSAA